MPSERDCRSLTNRKPPHLVLGLDAACTVHTAAVFLPERALFCQIDLDNGKMSALSSLDGSAVRDRMRRNANLVVTKVGRFDELV